MSSEKLFSKHEIITPEMAASILERNSNNRKLRSCVVARYARDMANGKWTFHHQGIAFDRNDVLVDGQHRLHAVMEAGVPIPMMVTYGLEPQSRVDIDGGLARNMSNALMFAGYEGISDSAVSTARAFMQGMSRWKTLTKHEIMDVFSKYGEAICFAVAQLSDEYSYVSRSSIRGAVARAYYHEPVPKLEAFCEILRTGMPSGIAGASVIVLRNQLIGCRVTKGSNQALVYAKAQRTIQAFCRDEVLTKLYGTTDDLYPLRGNE